MIARYPTLAQIMRQRNTPAPVQGSVRIGDWQIIEYEGNLVAVDKNGNKTILVNLQKKEL